MKRWLLFVGLICSFFYLAPDVWAQGHPWQPSSGHEQVPIWSGNAPNSPSNIKPQGETTAVKIHRGTGKPWVEVRNVSQPTITIYSPKGKNTGAAVIVFPGGGYRVLAIDLEGTEVCDWLASRGITGILLKYRVPKSGPYWDQQLRRPVTPRTPLALQDAQRTLRLVRHQAAKWHIDPHKIGVLGFSAGGHLSAAMSTHFNQPSYKPVDVADKESCRPDFAVVLYPGHLWTSEAKFTVDPDIHVTPKTPPTFLLQAENDDVDNINHSLVYYIALKNAGVPVEMHLYAEGGHAFGLRETQFPITRWPYLMEAWLKTLRIISER